MTDATEPIHRFGGFHVCVSKDYQAMSERAATFVAGRLAGRPDELLCAATGSTPTGMYAHMAMLAADRPDLFSRMRVVKLDEWGGVTMDDPCTCEHYLRRHLLGPLSVTDDRYMAFVSDAADPAAEAARVETWLEAHGPIGTCVLGLGANGHLALNEPADRLESLAHLAPLSEKSKQHVMLSATERAVDYGLTLGMADIFRSRTVVFLVSGGHKREMFGKMLTEGVTTSLPASLLLMHPEVRCFCDEEAWPLP